MNERKKPKFYRQGSNYLKRIKDKWKKPRGRDSKLMRKHKGKGRMPNVGFGSKRGTRFKHPSGLFEVMVSNVDDLANIDPKTQTGRISATVGKKKKAEIVKKAKELKIKLLNA